MSIRSFFLFIFLISFKFINLTVEKIHIFSRKILEEKLELNSGKLLMGKCKTNEKL